MEFDHNCSQMQKVDMPQLQASVGEALRLKDVASEQYQIGDFKGAARTYHSVCATISVVATRATQAILNTKSVISRLSFGQTGMFGRSRWVVFRSSAGSLSEPDPAELAGQKNTLMKEAEKVQLTLQSNLAGLTPALTFLSSPIHSL